MKKFILTCISIFLSLQAFTSENLEVKNIQENKILKHDSVSSFSEKNITVLELDIDDIKPQSNRSKVYFDIAKLSKKETNSDKVFATYSVPPYSGVHCPATEVLINDKKKVENDIKNLLQNSNVINETEWKKLFPKDFLGLITLHTFENPEIPRKINFLNEYAYYKTEAKTIYLKGNYKKFLNDIFALSYNYKDISKNEYELMKPYFE